MEHIAGHLEKIEQNMKLNTADPIARYGFTQLPNFILRNPDLSANAKTVYSLLLSYAWHNDLCFPGQERLAEHMGMHSLNRQPRHHRARGLLPHRNRAPRTGQDQLLHHQFRGERRSRARPDLHRCKSRFAPVRILELHRCNSLNIRICI